MKYIAWAAAALVLGLVVGGLGPRQKVRKLQAELDELAAQPCQSDFGRDLAMLMGRGTGPQLRRPGVPPPPGERSAEEILAEHPGAAEELAELEEAEAEAEEQILEELDEEFDPEEVEMLRAALELRKAQSRAALIEGADPDEDQLQDIDDAVAEMNDELMGLAEELVGMVADGDEPTRRDAMEFAADALDSLLTAEDRMRESLDPDQLDDLDEETLDPFSHVDPELMDILLELEGME